MCMDKLKNIKVMFVDIDGTLTNSQKEVTQENADAIKKVVEKGIKVILCSGRGNKYVEAKSKKANASPLVISSNGAQIYDYEKDKTIYRVPMDKELLKEVIKELEIKKAGFILNCTDIRFSNKTLVRKMDPEDKIYESMDDLKDKTIYQLVVEANSYRNLEELITYIRTIEKLRILNYSPAYLKGITTEKNYYLDVNSREVNKGMAIKEYLKLNNIKKEEAMCFGDHINDLDMFSVCGVTVAMGNAGEKLKSIADYVTDTNDNSGVAKFIEKYII